MRAILRNASKIAGGQHGVLTAAQLLGLELTRSTIDRWVQKGLLHPEFRGVYRLGHRAPSAEARYTAAVLACGEGAKLSGLAAAWHYRIVKGQPPPPEVTAPSEHDIPGIRTRQRTVESRIWRGIPTTTVPQTIADLASLLSLDDLARACHEAEVKFGRQSVDARRVKGAAKLRAVLQGDHALLLSEMERRFLTLLAENELPAPATNRKIGGHYVDCRWPEHHLTVELDSYRFHHSRHAWEQDHERRRAAKRRGDHFECYTYKDVCEEPAEMLEELAELLRFAAKLH
jgi:very-short-patch-repair endonuclease